MVLVDAWIGMDRATRGVERVYETSPGHLLAGTVD